MITDYTKDELKQIAAISAEQHIGLLTNCGVNRDNARQIIAMSDADLRAGLDAVRGRPNKTAAQEAMIAAGEREIIIRSI